METQASWWRVFVSWRVPGAGWSAAGRFPSGSLPQNVNYAVKSSVLSVLLESLPGVSSKLKEPYPPRDRKFEDVVRETEGATALVLVY